MLTTEATLEEIEAKLLSYDRFKEVLQQYLQRLLTSDQDTLAVVAEMLDAVKGISAARELAATPPDLHRILELQPEALYRYGGVATVEGTTAPPLLKGGVTKIDDPQVYGMSLISTWLDCIVSNPEQSLDSLRKVFLRATDAWGTELNRIFHVDLGRMQPIADPVTWLADLQQGQTRPHLHLARVNNIAQALGLEPPQPVGPVPLVAWKHLLQTRPVYDLTSRFVRPGVDAERSRLVALRRKQEQSLTCLYRLGLDPLPTPPHPPSPITLGHLENMLGCPLTAAVRLDMIERADHLSGSAPSTFSAFLPLGAILETFSLVLNHPPEIVLHDVTPPPGNMPQRLLRVAGGAKRVRLFRISPLPSNEWPSLQGWTRIYRFHDLADIGVAVCPPEAYLQVALREGEMGEPDGEVYFHRWGNRRLSLRITAQGLRRTAQTGTLILLHCDQPTALAVLSFLLGLIGPVAQEINPLVSELECQVRWRPYTGASLFQEEQ